MVGKYIILLILGLLISLDSYSQDSTFWMELMQPEAGKINKFYIDKIGNLFICSDNGLFKSTNDGISWKRIYLSNLSAIAIDSSNNIYLFDKNHLIYSNDFGESWLEKNSADSIISNSNIIGFDGFNILYCMRKMKYGVQNTLTFYISSDFGTSWAVRNYKFNLPSDYTNLFEFLDVKGTLITGGYYNVNNKSEGVIFISNDTGNSWEMVINIPVPYNIGYYNFASFFLGTSSGLYYTSNGGKDWKIQFADKAVSVDLVNNDDIFITTIDRKYHSSNKGISWEEINWTFDYDLRPIYYKSDQCIYGSAYNIGFYISKDKGISWEQSNKGFSAANVYDVCEDSKGDLYSVGDFGIYKSTDEGRSWLNIGFYGYRLSNIIIGKDNYIYVSNSIPHVIQGTIFRSTNGGMTWEDKSKGLVWQSGIQVLVHDIFITKQGHILLGTPFDEYWESTDNGDSWSEREVEGSAHCFAYNSEGHLFRGGDDGIFYRSTDEGQTWEKMKKADNYHSYEFYSMVFSPYSQVGFASGYSPI